MKQILNRKKLLKATFALSGMILFGCSMQNATNDDAMLAEQDAFLIQQDVVLDNEQSEEFLIIPEEDNANNAKTLDIAPCVLPEQIAPAPKTKRAVAASTPAEPRIVPVKPACTTLACAAANAPEKAAKSDGAATKEIAVKHKPEIAAATEVAPKAVAQVPPVMTTSETLAVSVPVPEVKPEAPVIEKTIETETIALEDTNTNGSEITILENVVDEQVINEVEDNSAALEAERLAAEEAARKAAEAEKAAKEAAEKARLQKELEALQAEKTALEQEKIRITQIKQTSKESCEDVKDWVAAEGTTLRSLLMDWGDRVGWRVVWNMDRDYTLEAGAVFRGRFVDVAAALLRSFARATPAPKGVFYKGNKVLVISTREDENAD